jgi:hypothetical protein
MNRSLLFFSSLSFVVPVFISHLLYLNLSYCVRDFDL